MNSFQAAEILAQIAEIKQMLEQQQFSHIMPYEDAIEYLQCSRATLDRMRQDGTLKVYKFKGRRRLYVKTSEIMNMLELLPVSEDSLAH